MTTTVVFSGGPFESGHAARAIDALEGVGLVVAADSGLHAAQAVGLAVDVVIGDMDSVTSDALSRATSQGAIEMRHPTDKDATDLELSLDYVRHRLTGPDAAPRGTRPQVLVVGSGGGRLDHLLGWVTVIGSPRYAVLDIEALLGETRVLPVHDRRVLHGSPGALVTLLALHGPAEGVRTRGLRWPLESASLASGSSLGVSNELLGPSAEVSVGRGVVTVVVPPDEGGAR
jgi:thiamine pyrophosphokinase